MQRRLHRIFLIAILALGMTGGSFIASMAATEAPANGGDSASFSETAGNPAPDVPAANGEAEADEEPDPSSDADNSNTDNTDKDNKENAVQPSVVPEKQDAALTQDTELNKQDTTTPATTPTDNTGHGTDTDTNPDKPELGEGDTPAAPPLPVNQRLYKENKGIMAGHTQMYYCPGKEPTDTEDGELEHYHCDACHRNFDVYQAEYEDVAKKIDIVIHVPGEAVEENHVEATPDQAGSYDSVIYCKNCPHEIRRETIHIEFYAPKQVVIEDPIMGDAHVAEIDENGSAVIKGFFKNLSTGGDAQETVTMVVAGKSYTFTAYSNGTVSGSLPKGFSVKGSDLIITGASESLDINIVDHHATSSVSVDPIPGEFAIDGGYWEPQTSEVLSAVSPAYDSNSQSSDAWDEFVTAGTTTDNTAANNPPTEDQLTAAEDALEVPSILADLFGSPDSNNANSSIGEEIGVTPSKLLIAADIALVAGLIIGLCALWKLGILKF